MLALESKKQSQTCFWSRYRRRETTGLKTIRWKAPHSFRRGLNYREGAQNARSTWETFSLAGAMVAIAPTRNMISPSNGTFRRYSRNYADPSVLSRLGPHKTLLRRTFSSRPTPSVDFLLIGSQEVSCPANRYLSPLLPSHLSLRRTGSGFSKIECYPNLKN